MLRNNTLLAQTHPGAFIAPVLEERFSLVVAKSQTGFQGFAGDICLWGERVYWTAAEFCAQAAALGNSQDTLSPRYASLTTYVAGLGRVPTTSIQPAEPAVKHVAGVPEGLH